MNEIKPIVHLVTDDEATGQTKHLFDQMIANVGKVPKWMRVMANCENTLISFFQLFKSLMDNEPAPQLLKWKVAHAVSEKNKCEFCIGVAKTKLINLGVTKEEIEKLEELSNKREKIAVKYATSTTEHAYNIDPNLIKKMKENFTDSEIVEITSVIGLFNYINRFNDALGVLPDIK